MENNNKKAFAKKAELQEVEEKLFAVEEKWIKYDIAKDTYDRWYATYNNDIENLKSAIERLSNDQSQAFSILEKKPEPLNRYASGIFQRQHPAKKGIREFGVRQQSVL